jgi:endonuclease III
MTEADRNAIQTMIAAAAQAIVEATAANLTDLRQELTRRVDTLRERLDILAPVIISVDARMAGMTRAMDRLIGQHDTTQATQAAQARAIDDLARRVAELERKAS